MFFRVLIGLCIALWVAIVARDGYISQFSAMTAMGIAISLLFSLLKHGHDA